MKQFEFSLDRLLRVKRQVERIAELEQQRAREGVDRARNHLNALREQLTRVSDQFTASIGRTMAAHQWTTASVMSERLGQSISLAEQDLETSESKLLSAAQQWDQWRQEARAADQSRLDEVGLRRWMENQNAVDAQGAA